MNRLFQRVFCALCTARCWAWLPPRPLIRAIATAATMTVTTAARPTATCSTTATTTTTTTRRAATSCTRYRRSPTSRAGAAPATTSTTVPGTALTATASSSSRRPSVCSCRCCRRFYTTIWVRGVPYYYADDVYYAWRPEAHSYVVVEPPQDEQAVTTAPPSDDIYIYPKNGQSAEQQATDRYECHRWAADQTGFDPTRPLAASSPPGDGQARRLSPGHDGLPGRARLQRQVGRAPPPAAARLCGMAAPRTKQATKRTSTKKPAKSDPRVPEGAQARGSPARRGSLQTPRRRAAPRRRRSRAAPRARRLRRRPGTPIPNASSRASSPATRPRSAHSGARLARTSRAPCAAPWKWPTTTTMRSPSATAPPIALPRRSFPSRCSRAGSTCSSSTARPCPIRKACCGRRHARTPHPRLQRCHHRWTNPPCRR